MNDHRVLLLIPYFGEFPAWMQKWRLNVGALAAHGFDVLLDTDEEAFHQRVIDHLDVEPPPLWGTGKTWDYRAALGLLYETELEGYDFWGHTDLDCVYGRVERYVTDEFLDGLDVHSNHTEYMCGCWSLYRNIPAVNTLFLQVLGWDSELVDAEPTGWVEGSFSEAVLAAESRGDLRKVWNQWQAFTEPQLAAMSTDGDRLLCRGEEVMMAHFRRTKVWPL